MLMNKETDRTFVHALLYYKCCFMKDLSVMTCSTWSSCNEFKPLRDIMINFKGDLVVILLPLTTRIDGNQGNSSFYFPHYTQSFM